MARSDTALSAVMDTLIKAEIDAVYCGSTDLPDILVVDKDYGLIPLFVLLKDEFELSNELKQDIRRKISNLREECPTVVGLLQPAIVVNIEANSENRHVGVNNAWLKSFKKTSERVLPLALAEIKLQFNQDFIFNRRKRNLQEDFLRNDREHQRFILSEEQQTVANLTQSPLLWISGTAGSGKTLIMISRINIMSKINPHWNIQIVCFNQSLKSFFKNEFKGRPNINVSAFSEFTKSRGAVFRFYHKVGREKISVSGEEANRNLIAAIDQGISRDVDALFIDEVQDFYPAWIKYCMSCLKKDTGSATLVGDEEQAIYRNAKLIETLAPYKPHRVHLTKAYRSTREIMRVVDILLGRESDSSSESSPSGPNPDLIFVDVTKNKMNSLGEAVIEDVISLIKLDKLNPGDIAILATTNYYRLSLVENLRKELASRLNYEILVDGIERGAAYKLDMTRDSIKVTTIYNAKGLEFPAVLLLGLEDLDKPQNDDIPEEHERNSRLNLVGPSRAKDRLLIYYTRQNSFVDRLRDNSKTVNFRTYPEDYEKRI